MDNLPGSQLRAEAEIMESDEALVKSDGDWDEEDDIPLSQMQLAYKRKYVWEKADLVPEVLEWSPDHHANPNFTPLQLFEQMFDHEIIKMFTRYTNMYAASRNRSGRVTESEIRAFFGILLLSGYVQLPRRRMYWEKSADTHNPLVSNAMSRDKFEFIMSNLHCCDNTALNQEDRFAKVRPLFDKISCNFQAYAPNSETHSVDESMVPYFGRHGCKQFIRGKPIRYGFKLWMGATSSARCIGYCVWIEPYQGAKTRLSGKYRSYGLGPSVVLEYCDLLSKLQPLPYHLFFDNFFTTIPLMEILLMRKIKATGTIREDRLMKCPLIPKDKMKKESVRGAYDYRSTGNKVLVVKWNDNSIVSVATNNLKITPLHNVSRVSKKKRVMVEQPHVIHTYNKFMGGVDRCDENISYYRTSIRGKKWYFCLIAYCLDLSVQNAWHLYRGQGGTMDQLAFRRQITVSLLETNRVATKRGRPSQLENITSRFDNSEHFLVRQENQTRCRQCHKKVLKKCEKCNVALHMDCFIGYHQKI